MTSYRHDRVVPYEDSSLSKTEQVADMFDRIAPRYDFLNRFLSGGIDLWWRKKADSPAHETWRHAEILDVATGTGDMAIMTYRRLSPRKITGLDISEGHAGPGPAKDGAPGTLAPISPWKAATVPQHPVWGRSASTPSR